MKVAVAVGTWVPCDSLFRCAREGDNIHDCQLSFWRWRDCIVSVCAMDTSPRYRSQYSVRAREFLFRNVAVAGMVALSSMVPLQFPVCVRTRPRILLLCGKPKGIVQGARLTTPAWIQGSSQTRETPICCHACIFLIADGGLFFASMSVTVRIQFSGHGSIRISPLVGRCARIILYRLRWS